MRMLSVFSASISPLSARATSILTSEMNSTGQEVLEATFLGGEVGLERENPFLGGQFFGHIGMKIYTKVGTFGIDG